MLRMLILMTRILFLCNLYAYEIYGNLQQSMGILDL